MASHAPRWILLMMLGVLACDEPAKLPIDQWELTVEGYAGQPRPVTLPTRLDDGRVPSTPGRYRLRHRVALPAAWRGQALQLVVPDFAAVTTLRVDGLEATDLDTSSKHGYRRRGPHAWSVPAAATADGELELELVVAHRWTQSAWWGTVPRLLPAGESDRAATAVYVFNFLISGAALIALCQSGFASLIVYFADRRRRAYLPFGVQALVAAFYPLFVAGWSQSLLGVYDGAALGISLALACAISIQFTHDFFGLAGRPWRGYSWLCGVVCVIAIGFSNPFLTTRVAGVATILYVSIVMGHQVITCARLVHRGPDKRSALYSLISWLILVVTGLPDFAWWLGFGDMFGGIRLASIGLGSFAVFLSLLMSQKHIHSLRNSDTLTAELEHRVKQLELRRTEIELLNEELRRQIADRASQIYAAVALASSHGRAAALSVGDVIQGRYRVERTIGAGGMGTIYEVTRLSDGRRLALKVPQEVHGESLARLAREAQIASTLAHPNVVAVVDVDVATDGFLYLVMELVEGTSLHGMREHYGNVGWALPVLREIVEGLTAMHRVGIVHRDLKPANILVTAGPHDVAHVKIADFGISLNPESERFVAVDVDESTSELDVKTAQLPGPISERPTKLLHVRGRVNAEPAPPAASAGAPSQAPASACANVPLAPNMPASSFLTRTGQIPGTPAYMAPELIDGRGVITAAADMFALGVLAHELLTGSRPFSEPPVFALIARRPFPLPRSIEEAWPSCPRDLARVLDACLSPNPSARPTAAELGRVLQAARDLGHATVTTHTVS